MKQTITLKQVSDLSPVGKKNLKQYFFDKPLEPCLLSIGQMIEFIEHQKPEWRGLQIVHMSSGELSDAEWSVTGNYSRIADGTYSDELCDALWEMIKEILEKE